MSPGEPNHICVLMTFVFVKFLNKHLRKEVWREKNNSMFTLLSNCLMKCSLDSRTIPEALLFLQDDCVLLDNILTLLE